VRYITLRWLSGASERVFVHNHWVRDGILILEIKDREYRNIPLTALKEWTEEPY
jgi:hypothetical protein